RPTLLPVPAPHTPNISPLSLHDALPISTAGTLTFANLADTGHTDTPTPITTDGTFDLSLSGDTDANGVAGVVYQQNLNGAGWTEDPNSTRLNPTHGNNQYAAVGTNNAGN